ncbi:serine/threonine protein kinase psk1 [Modicella reniformis]|uniref:non-specific serine/threonine protein kinase n=1 Tax=Modicella reniformis TaxID=1440133 RepID=A0A9P6IL06_9FUNG|nr:serine/threonine protein kinase psk1 [Modicella reniformis]
MDLFSFDHDDHPTLRERTLSVDSVHSTDLSLEACANLSLNPSNSNSITTNSAAGLGPVVKVTACPILSPRPVVPASTLAARKAATTTAVTHADGSTTIATTIPFSTSPLSLGFYQTNGNSSNKHLPAFFHQVDREQALTPESTYLKSRSPQQEQHQQSNNAVFTPAAVTPSLQNSDNEAENDVEYEVKIDQDFDAHAPHAIDSRGHSPRPGQFSTGNSGESTQSTIGTKPANVSPPAGPRRPKHKMTPDDFKFLKVIGRGAYGKVYLVRHISTNALYAMKVLKKASIIVHAKDTECTMSERKILEAIRHPFIVKLHYAFQTDHRLYLILEYASGGELFTHLATERMFSEEVAAFYAAQLVLALEHLHSLGIIYRDLKPENIMLNAHGDIVLTDFGLSKVPLENSDGRTNTVCGTIEYMAPEVISERVRYDCTVDWWSLGIVIHDMLTGSPPFVAGNRKKTMDAILNKKLNLPYYLSSDAKDLLTKLLKRTPSARLGYGPKGIENIKNHRFFRKTNWKLLALRELEPPIVPFFTGPESVENFNSEFTSMPVQESPILTFGHTGTHPTATQPEDRSGCASGHHTPSRYMTAPSSSASSAGATATMNMNGHDDHHAGGIPMAKTRSSSPDHHHFQDFSYIATSHLPSPGYLDPLSEH